jgi:periplasmic protein TonB
MTALAAPLSLHNEQRALPQLLRWGAAAGIVLAVHGGGLWFALTRQPATEPAGEPSAPIMIELAPMAVAPEAPAQDVAPGPQQTESQPEPTPAPDETPPPEEPPPEPVVEPVPQPEISVPLPDIPPPPTADVFLPPKVETPPPPPAPRPPTPRPQRVEPTRPVRPNRQVVTRTSAPPTAEAQRADTAAAPSPGAAAAASAAAATWKGALFAHLNRYKRAPFGAPSGTVQVTFTIDRSGRVTAARLTGSSGNAALDSEAVAMMHRASPVPAPPATLATGPTMTIAVPVRYTH